MENATGFARSTENLPIQVSHFRGTAALSGYLFVPHSSLNTAGRLVARRPAGPKIPCDVLQALFGNTTLGPDGHLEVYINLT